MIDVEPRLRRLVADHLEVDPARLLTGARLGEDLCLDSLAAIELTMVIEDEFDVALPDEETSGLRTFGDLVALVSGRVTQRAASG
ncbi:MAG: phosphopantetheine-binding protein [Actinomycetota bacterium]|nr:phosphopantetheine-binding protein [Actinomycetota bacterium]